MKGARMIWGDRTSLVRSVSMIHCMMRGLMSVGPSFLPELFDAQYVDASIASMPFHDHQLLTRLWSTRTLILHVGHPLCPNSLCYRGVWRDSRIIDSGVTFSCTSPRPTSSPRRPRAHFARRPALSDCPRDTWASLGRDESESMGKAGVKRALSG